MSLFFTRVSEAAIYGLTPDDKGLALNITCTRPMDGCALRGQGSVAVQGSNNFRNSDGALVWIRTPVYEVITLINGTNAASPLTATCSDESCTCVAFDQETGAEQDCYIFEEASEASPSGIEEAAAECNDPHTPSGELCPNLMRDYGLLTKDKFCRCRYNFCGEVFVGCSCLDGDNRDEINILKAIPEEDTCDGRDFCPQDSRGTFCTVADRFEPMVEVSADSSMVITNIAAESPVGAGNRNEVMVSSVESISTTNFALACLLLLGILI